VHGDNVLYENLQWKLVNNGSEWFFEQIPHDGTQPYWCYVSEVMMHDYSLGHVAEKTWCDVGLWSDVCRSAAELSPHKPEYDLEAELEKVARRKAVDDENRRINARTAKDRGRRFLKPSEIADL
jgi:hypothetical protein